MYMLYNLCQGLSSCVYQSLSNIDQFPALTNLNTTFNSSQSDAGILIYRAPNFDMGQVKTPPSRWPGVEGLAALLAREKDEDAPNLRLLLAETFVAITMSLFCYASTIYDSRWLYRLAAHSLSEQAFSTLFGGGCERRLRSAVPVFRVESSKHGTLNQNSKPPINMEGASEQVALAKSIGYDGGDDFFDSDAESDAEEDSEDPIDDDDDMDLDGENRADKRPHDCPTSYAWLLIRLTLIIHMKHRLTEFLLMCGFEFIDIPTLAPHLEKIFKILNGWSTQLEEFLDSYTDGCPKNFLRNMDVGSEAISTTLGSEQTATLLQKYRSLLEPGNTPFEYEGKGIRPVRRLWSYLVKQEHLSAYFIKYIFGRTDKMDGAHTSVSRTSSINNSNSTALLNGLSNLFTNFQNQMKKL